MESPHLQGVLGFSQGAALAAVVAAIVSLLSQQWIIVSFMFVVYPKLERPDAYEPFKVDGQPIHPKLYSFLNTLIVSR